MDLTKITEPFGLLDAETQAALKAHGGPYEFFDGESWRLDQSPFIGEFFAIRVKPLSLTKPSVDWSIFGPEVVAIARDKDGTAAAYARLPMCVDEGWLHSGKRFYIDGFIASYTPGTCDWRESLVERPEGV